MKKKLFIFTLCVMMIFASTITCFAYDAGYTATQGGLTLSDGTYLEYPQEVATMFADVETSKGCSYSENKYIITKMNFWTEDDGIETYTIWYYPDNTNMAVRILSSAAGTTGNTKYAPTVYVYDDETQNVAYGQSIRVFYHHNTVTGEWTFDTVTNSKDYVMYDTYDEKGREYTLNEADAVTYFKEKVLVKSTHDLYTDKTATEVFWTAPKLTLPPMAEKMEMRGVTEQIMKILPIGLACLVGWIALRKALAILQGILHQA